MAKSIAVTPSCLPNFVDPTPEITTSFIGVTPRLKMVEIKRENVSGPTGLSHN